MGLYRPLTDKKWNQFLKFTCDIWQEDGFNAMHTEVNSVFPTSNRVFYDFLYLLDKEGMAILSSKGNESIPEELRNEAVNCKGKVKGHV